MTQAAIAVEVTENRKTGPVSSTYVSQHSCPGSCPLRGQGCYAEAGPVGYVTRRLNASEVVRADTIAREEAEAIDSLSSWRPLRLHVVGDCRTRASARIVSAAADRYAARFFQRMKEMVFRATRTHLMAERWKYEKIVWTYTHAWRNVERSDWGGVSVLASCETAAQAEEATERGYAVALIVEDYEQEAAYPLEGTSLKVVPCPYQTRGTPCDQCRLCWDDLRLIRDRVLIGFRAHGAGKNRVLQQLNHEENS